MWKIDFIQVSYEFIVILYRFDLFPFRAKSLNIEIVSLIFKEEVPGLSLPGLFAQFQSLADVCVFLH